MEVLKTSQEIVHEGWLIKSPPTKLWRAVGIQCYSLFCTYLCVGPVETWPLFTFVVDCQVAPYPRERSTLDPGAFWARSNLLFF